MGIGPRPPAGIVYLDVGDDFALPQWTLDPEAEQPEPWRYPGTGAPFRSL